MFTDVLLQSKHQRPQSKAGTAQVMLWCMWGLQWRAGTSRGFAYLLSDDSRFHCSSSMGAVIAAPLFHGVRLSAESP